MAANVRLASSMCVLVLIAGCGARDEAKAPPPESVAIDLIPDVIAHVRRGGIAIEQDSEHTGWWKVAGGPGAEAFDLVVSFKDFPPGTTASEMERELMAYSLPHHLNTPARLAMSYPHLQSRLGVEAKDPPDAQSLPVSKELVRLFRAYRGLDGGKGGGVRSD